MTTMNMHMKFEIEIPKQTWLKLRKPCRLQIPETEKFNMAARQPFWKWQCWKSIGSYPYAKVLCRWSLELIFKAKVKLESGNKKIQYGCQAAILTVMSLKINRLLPMTTMNMHMKFEIEIPKQTWLKLRKPCRLQIPETEKFNMAARQPFWKWQCWKSIGSYPYAKVLCHWSLELIFKAKVKLESGNKKIQYGCQAAILTVMSLKINRLLPMVTINMHMKFEIEIPKQTWLMLRKPCRLQTDGRTDGRTRWIQYTLPPTSLAKYIYSIITNNIDGIVLNLPVW